MRVSPSSKIRSLLVALLVLTVVGCGKREARVDAAHILEPVEPARVGTYPEQGYFPVARSMATSAVLGGPVIYDELQDLYYHGVWISPVEWQRFVLANNGRGIPVVTKPVDPAMPRVGLLTAEMQRELAAIEDILVAHPDIAADVYGVPADSDDDAPPLVTIDPQPGPIPAILAQLQDGADHLERLLAEEAPSDLAHRLIAARERDQHQLVRAHIAGGTEALAKLMDGRWQELMAEVTVRDRSVRERTMMAAWSDMVEEWNHLEGMTSGQALPSYEDLALRLRRCGSAIRKLEALPAYQGFLAGELFTDSLTPAEMTRLRYQSLATITSLARCLVSVAQVMRPQVYRHDERDPVLIYGYAP